MVYAPVPAGTVLRLNFGDLGFERPEVEKERPVVVLPPKKKQTCGTVIVVPLTSAVGNFNNKNAVEVTNRGFVSQSPTGRSFAICDKPITVSLRRLKEYSKPRQRGRNYAPGYQIQGQDLKNVRMAVFRAMNTDKDFYAYFSVRGESLVERLHERQRASCKKGPLAAKRRRCLWPTKKKGVLVAPRRRKKPSELPKKPTQDTKKGKG